MPASRSLDPEARRRVVQQWIDALHDHVDRHGASDAADLLTQLGRSAASRGVAVEAIGTNGTAESSAAPSPVLGADRDYPGDLALEGRIEALVRWNAMAMVVRANRASAGIGGHISTYMSAATLFETGFHHAFRAGDGGRPADRVFFQGHASTGVYARAFVEGRLSEADLDGFRRELSSDGLPSYPHPRCMPGFWEFPSVSMGLAPLMGIYQARFDRYLQRRGLVEHVPRTWVFCGDGEMDEPESLAGITVAVRERLDNLVLVVNCNLQRLDGPVRPDERIVGELRALFAGAGWEVIPVLWGTAWQPLFDADRDGALRRRFDATVDGDWQRWTVAGAAVFRDEFFGADERLAALVEERDDDELAELVLARGGHDPRCVLAAYERAMAADGRPTLILAQTVKGHGLGEAGEGRNATHKRKTLDHDALAALRDRFGLSIDDADLDDVPYLRPDDDCARYLRERREALGGALPRRATPRGEDLRRTVPTAPFERAFEGSGDRTASTTSAAVRILTALLQDDAVGELLVPIVPDEARTFGMEPLFRSVGIHAAEEPDYEPVDAGSLVEYRETPDGQLLEEGITEAGSMASAIAAGLGHVTHGLPTVPFYFFYSMFGFQRVGDLIWAAGDAMARGFLIGATSGRTTLNGEGLQHQDGHSLLLACSNPAVRAYDTTYAYEVAVIVEDGLRRFWQDGAEELVYLAVSNAAYEHPPLPDGVREGILRGIYRLEGADGVDGPSLRILAAGPLVPDALAARRALADRYGVAAEVFAVTSWSSLYLDAMARERDRRQGRDGGASWLVEALGDGDAPIVAVSDFVQHLPHLLARWLPGDLHALGTHGFGRSDTKAALRRHFEVDRDHVVHAAVAALVARGELEHASLARAADAIGGFSEEPPYPRPMDARTAHD